jgi:hypothetical protein
LVIAFEGRSSMLGLLWSLAVLLATATVGNSAKVDKTAQNMLSFNLLQIPADTQHRREGQET